MPKRYTDLVRMAKHVIGLLRELPPGTRKLVNIRGRPIAVFNIKGELFALLNRCPHQGANLCDGKLVGLVQSREPGEYKYSRSGEILRCPWHGWEFDVRTGQSWCEPDRIKAKTYEIEATPGETLVKGPYVAETFTVTVEEDYVVVDV